MGRGGGRYFVKRRVLVWRLRRRRRCCDFYKKIMSKARALRMCCAGQAVASCERASFLVASDVLGAKCGCAHFPMRTARPFRLESRRGEKSDVEPRFTPFVVCYGAQVSLVESGSNVTSWAHHQLINSSKRQRE